MSLTKVTYAMIQGSAANVLDFGADPTGVADSTTAIQAALDASSNVYIPTGNFKITGTITVNENGTLFGDGFSSVIENASVFRGINVTGNAVTIANLRITGSGSTTGHVNGRGLITVENATNCVISKVRVYQARSSGIVIGSSSNCIISDFLVDTTLEHGVYISLSNQIAISNGTIYHAGQLEPLTVDTGSGLKIAGCNDVVVTNVVIKDAIRYGAAIDGYVDNTSNRIELSNIDAQSSSNSYAGLIVTNYCDTTFVSNSYFEGNYGVFVNSGYATDPSNVYLNNIKTNATGANGIRVLNGDYIYINGGKYETALTPGVSDIRIESGCTNVYLNVDNAIVTDNSGVAYGINIDSTGAVKPINATQTIGTSDLKFASINGKSLVIEDGITAPSTISGSASIYVDVADGDLKIKFGDGTVKTIVTD